jgi:hypothetical protein
MPILISASKAMVANLAAGIVAGAILVGSGPAAKASSFIATGAPEQSGLGSTFGSASIFDTLQIFGLSGPILPSTNSITLNELIFTAGPNATAPANYQFSFTEKVTINTGTASGTAVLNVPFNLSINSSDTLTVVGGSTVSIPVGSSVWNIVVNGFSFAPNSGGPEIGFLTAQISDPPSTPLPAALVLFGSGLGAMELLRRRRKDRPAASA